MPKSPSTASAKRTYFTAFLTMVMTNIFYVFMAWTLAHNPAQLAKTGYLHERTALTVLCALSLVAAIVNFLKTTSGKIGGNGRPVEFTPAQFQAVTMTTMTYATGSSILGMFLFFSGLPFQTFLYYVAATVIVEVPLILPAALQYWEELEKTGR